MSVISPPRRKYRKSKFSITLVGDVHRGTKLIADDGFTCMKDRARRTVLQDCSLGRKVFHQTSGKMIAEPMNSKGRLYVTCDEGRHYLDGQWCGPGEHDMKSAHYIGFWLAGREPKLEKAK